MLSRANDGCVSTFVNTFRTGVRFRLTFFTGTIVDAGANIGMASIFFAQKYPDAKIIAVEAEASNFAMLARNVQPYPGSLESRWGDQCQRVPTFQ
jgi:tRNA1(Val) A37 N6-methylase TrmN6